MPPGAMLPQRIPMRTLHLLRHAKSDWHDDLRDAERPLAPRGRRREADGRVPRRVGPRPRPRALLHRAARRRDLGDRVAARSRARGAGRARRRALPGLPRAHPRARAAQRIPPSAPCSWSATTRASRSSRCSSPAARAPRARGIGKFPTGPARDLRLRARRLAPARAPAACASPRSCARPSSTEGDGAGNSDSLGASASPLPKSPSRWTSLPTELEWVFRAVGVIPPGITKPPARGK